MTGHHSGERIVLASNNAGKVREINQLLASEQITVVAQKDFNIPDAIEDGLSFVENAIKKARHASSLSGLPAIADDSGIEVDALNGAPGIYSARFAGPGASDEENLQKLLSRMEEVPEAKRTARFQCLMVYMRHSEDPTPIICQGSWEGRILFEPQGDNGFGYDPIFYVPTHDCSSAQLAPETKNSLSHRGQALKALMQSLSA
ncbi:MAG: RdgB/HAM1 family non-canonical purine NTP pyrophosphatase [Candidatus Thiodiazotropha taylori]|uniref:dITP/XTP pyrophosphatase n=1 Tax=Candidatus Thiodiazotropha taylori TaxID=2792791 RepID=A0A9E4N5H1_9GAMM|nr:RdgB/HAM1 family non-canonical purine NTP pyrophosphatase [Candidatus Thiodiazotropha taylori]MCG7947855.1 RdgB/HAM1 family non-canonical purine NTP pyrophosphatase [Candidatus Thiodiazotropha taylori]MCG8042905.1 RdgB/HAM1 family non-canonical purine NTP pyrophosphatase [Candidatus Thiodiazotropha taylori]MCG8051167.1 RdgB/HAM1 family non-canonical purine NTP pyrophosphatase [Candidatus Thiodiazotropha taylori]MCG8056296.1 RdgB/HAM1 family non-canonical purine NTP pyrophosphatase [Candidatu